MPSDNTPTLAAVFRAALEARLVQVHVSIPGSVESYDAARRAVSVKPLIKRGYEADDGSRQVESLPVIVNVPVEFPGGGAFDITWPLSSGDTGLIVFTEASIDRWLARGGEVDPGDERRHHLSDAVFRPGLRPFSDSGIAADSSAMVLTGSEVRVGGSSGVQPTFMSTAFMTAFTTFIGALGTAVGGIPTGGAAAASGIATAYTTFVNSINLNGLTQIAKVK